MQIYRTYADKIPVEFNVIRDSGINKPVGGLWGCKDDAWHKWCVAEEFPCSHKYFEWHLRPGTKVYTVDNENDFIWLLKNYHHDINCGLTKTIDTIDYMKLWEDGYDAVELTEEGNDKLHYGVRDGIHDFQVKNTMTIELVNDTAFSCPMLLGMNGWDVPSINVFDPNKSVVVISDLKTDYKNNNIIPMSQEVLVTLDDWSETAMKGGMPYVAN